MTTVTSAKPVRVSSMLNARRPSVSGVICEVPIVESCAALKYMALNSPRSKFKPSYRKFDPYIWLK